MRFRQVHLDFHTSEAIAGIGARFSKPQFQEMLRLGHVDSVTVFSKCHHGWAYHPSEANETHPNLSFDLLGAQIAAAHEIGVKTPVYLSAGLDERLAKRHPEWLFREAESGDRPGYQASTWSQGFLVAGYHMFCMNTPYLDILTAQIAEVVRNYDADGIFLDIVGPYRCLCQHCLASILAAGQDPTDRAAVVAQAERTYAEYARRTNEAAGGLPVFHNGSHIRRGRRDLARFNTHLELESLPTGGWGYDHFPLSARYAATIGMDYLGMTGKFHTSWGEFGGFKHPNALRFEAALSIAMGARCSIGDQLHPDGEMDPATYALIGAAYAEVERKEAYCAGARGLADVALLSAEAYAVESGRSVNAGTIDAGVVRILLEGKYLFDVIDYDADFAAYKVLILPDAVRVNDRLKEKLAAFLAGGGRVLATGESGLAEGEDVFALDLGVRYEGPNPFRPDYFRPHWPVANLGEAAFVFYQQGQTIALDGGEALGHRENPYFNRAWNHFSSHQHTPNDRQDAGPGVVESANGIYIAWAIFEEYATKGSLVLKEVVRYALDRLLDGRKTLATNLPAQGVTTLTRQDAERRYVNHLLYAAPVRRGEHVDIIEDVLPVHDVAVTLRLPETVTRAILQPQGDPLPFMQNGDIVWYTVPRLECHQMVVLEY